MADDNLADNSVAEGRINHEVVPGESTPISSASRPAVSAICSASADLQQQDAASAATPKKAFLTRPKYQLQSELGALNREKEQHKVRLQSLRKELSHIKATEWLYEPIEKLIGRGNQ